MNDAFERPPAAVTIDEVTRYLDGLEMDRAPLVIEELRQDWMRGRIPTSEVKLRPGGYVPGPTMMSAVDLASWILVFTRNGITPMALTWDLKMNFLRPAHGADVVVDARQTKFGRLCHASIDLYLDGDADRLVGHATTTYVLP